MAVRLSTAAVNFITGRGSFRELLEDSLLGIWSGTAPATADLAATPSAPLCIVSKASGSTLLRNGWGGLVKLTVGTHGAETFSFNVTIGSETLLATAVYDNAVADAGDVQDVAVRLVKLFTDVGLRACCTGVDGVIYVMAPSNQTLVIASTGTGTVAITTAIAYATDANNCLQFGPPTVGVISKVTGTWSGLNLLTGVAGWFRFYRPGDDHTADIAPWTKPRVQGAISGSGVEGSFSNTTLTAGATLTIGNADLALPLST